MRATGIVRRIDELGRVVIPKEIRRTLRIREGDPLEIYTDHDGEVVLKKYSPIGEIASVAKDYTDALLRTLGHVAIITDRDVVVSASGSPKKELWEKPISSEMESAMHNRQLLRLGDIEGMDPARAGMRLIPVTGEGLWPRCPTCRTWRRFVRCLEKCARCSTASAKTRGRAWTCGCCRWA